MKRHFILGIMAVAALASCNKSEVLNQESLNEKGITFSAYVGKAAQTKATTIDATNAAQAGIGILAWRTGAVDADHATGVVANAPSFMPNIKLTLGAEITTGEGENPTGTGKYSATYSPVRYWPSTGSKVSFFAYAPYKDLEDATNNDNVYNPNNLTVSTGVNAHILTLNVPKGDETVAVYKDQNEIDNEKININTGDVYNTQTDFMVARVGNGDQDSGYEAGVDADGQAIQGKFVGINQNLTKDHTGNVSLAMRHALAKISFEVKAGEQDEPYQDAKVVFDHIVVNGTFAGQGDYNLLTESWNNLVNPTEKYGFVNTFGDNAVNTDPFNPIADEVYNLSPATEAEEDETNTPTGEWYKLNKSTHDLMVIPFTAEATPSTITSITGMYMVQTFGNKQVEQQKKDGEGNPMWERAEEGATENVDADGYKLDQGGNRIPVMETVTVYGELEDWRDNVYFSTTLSSPLQIEAGKHYIFRFNIELKKIEFEVAIEGWDSTNNVYDVQYVPVNSDSTGGNTPENGGIES